MTEKAVRIDIEVQVSNVDNYRKRSMSYWAKLYQESLSESLPYEKSGWERGREEGREEIIRVLLGKGMGIEEVAELTGQSIEKIIKTKKIMNETM